MNTQQSGYYSTRELSNLFHVDESTVKRWTNCHKLKCFRTPGGHRKYTSDQIIEFIKTYNYELDAERKNAKNPDPAKWKLVPEYSPEMMRELYFSLALRGSVDLLVEVLQRSYLSHHPLIDIYENTVGKSVVRLLEMQNTKTITQEETKKAVSAMMESILQFRLLIPRNLPNGRIAISASLTYGMQDIILLCATHILEISGWKVYYLGPNTSVAELSATMRRYFPDRICLPAEYVLNDQNGGVDVSFTSLVSTASADCMIFDYFDEIKQRAEYVPYRRLSRFAEFSEYIHQPVPSPVHTASR